MSNRKSQICTGAVIGAALLAGAPSAFAQTCSPTLGIQFPGLPDGTVFAVGQSFNVNVNFGAISVPGEGGSMTINTLSLRLDCVPGTGCEPECVDAGTLIAYQGDSSIQFGCVFASTVTSNNPGGGTGTNTIVFSFNPPLVLSANQSCDLQFGLTVNSLGVAASPKLITSRVSFLGDCSGTTLDALVCGTFEIPLTNPDIEINKTACPSLVCADGEDVLYTYVVTTGEGNAPISNVVVTDSHCGPVVFVSGDNGNGILEVGESWIYECTANITETTTNIGTVNGEWIGNAGNVPVSDTDTMTVDVVQVNVTPGNCETTYTAKTGLCTGETCSWTGPGDFTSNLCSITLGAGNATGTYCVTVTCPGAEEACPFGCGPGVGQVPCEARSAECCIEFDQPDAPPCVINTGPATVCVGDTHNYCGPAGLDSYLWSELSAGCNIVGSNTGQCVDVTFTAPGNCLLELAVVDEGCPNDCEKRIVAEECGGGEGRTPGFWKQAHHFGHWPDQWCPHESCGCTPTQFCAVFNCAGAGAGCASAVNGAYAGKTLLQVISQGGGGFKALGRHAVAGLLNSGVDPNILDYAFSTAEVIAMVNNAIATCQTQPAHGDLAGNNELEGGDLGGQSFCTDLDLNGAINNNDLSILLNNWGKSGMGDIDNNGVVGSNDLSILLSNWGSY